MKTLWLDEIITTFIFIGGIKVSSRFITLPFGKEHLRTCSEVSPQMYNIQTARNQALHLRRFPIFSSDSVEFLSLWIPSQNEARDKIAFGSGKLRCYVPAFGASSPGWRHAWPLSFLWGQTLAWSYFGVLSFLCKDIQLGSCLLIKTLPESQDTTIHNSKSKNSFCHGT